MPLGRRPLEELGVRSSRWMEMHREGAWRARAWYFMSGKPKSFIVGADIREFDQLDIREAKVIDGITPVLPLLDRTGSD